MRKQLTTLMGLVLAVTAIVHVRADDDLERRASWDAPTLEAVKARIDNWIGDLEPDELSAAKIEALWPSDQEQVTSEQLLERVTLSIAVLDDDARKLVQFCQLPSRTPILPKFAVLARSEPDDNQPARLPDWALANLKLMYGRWLAQERFYDEALEQIAEIEPQGVVDPAMLLFYQSAGYHRMMDKEKCLPTIARLMEKEDTIPRRYATVARMMEADLKPLKADSLDEVARLMDEIQRRLDIYQAGTKVREQEEAVIAKLDKLIEELEKAPGGGGGGGGARSNNPAPDSTPLGGTGPGNVDPRRIGTKSGWGNLPAKERMEALQQISKELPAHYREVIEEYFRKLAQDGAK